MEEMGVVRVMVVWLSGFVGLGDSMRWTRRRAAWISESVCCEKGSRLLRKVPVNSVGSIGSRVSIFILQALILVV